MTRFDLALWLIPALIAGALPQTGALPQWALAVAAGGWLVAAIGSRRIAPGWIRKKVRALLPAIAGCRLAFQ